MIVVCGVAGATGRVARPGSHAPAWPQRADAVASPVTSAHGHGPWPMAMGMGMVNLGPPSAGGPELRKGESRRRAPSQLT